jgi:UDP-N-acetylenolpyruvoylglucosamine reductase
MGQLGRILNEEDFDLSGNLMSNVHVCDPQGARLTGLPQSMTNGYRKSALSKSRQAACLRAPFR